MRQLLILAIETAEPLAITHLSLNVPRLHKGTRGNGVLLDGQVTAKAVAAAAKEAVLGLDEGLTSIHGEHITVEPHLSAGEIIAAGFRETMAVLDRHHKLIERHEAFNRHVLSTIVEPDEPQQA